MSTVFTSEQVYDSWAQTYDQSIKRMRWNAPDILFSRLRPYVQDGTSIFEAGIGTGLLAQKFADSAKNVRISGVDVSTNMIRRVIERGIVDAYQIVKLDLENEQIPFLSNIFDLSVSCGVLEYIEFPQQTLEHMARITKPGGMIGLAYEADEDHISRKRSLAKTDATGLTEDGKRQKGAFFYYHHAPPEIRDIFKNVNVEEIQSFRFDSVDTGYEPIRYNLFLGQKL